MDSHVRLVEPDVAWRDSFLAALAEFQAEGQLLNLDRERIAADFPGYVAELTREADPAHVGPDRVPGTILWLFDGGAFVGRVSIRQALNDHVRRIGGHVGYRIRSSRRRQGYGTRILALARPRAKALGLARVLLTFDEDNIASRRIIKRNGGVLEDTVEVAGVSVPVRRYWIELP
jgi:predicted acetyltransferase